jgi:2-isopropylmalate synthase
VWNTPGQLCDEVEFSAEDAGRTDPDSFCQLLEVVIDAGASVGNISDTVGYCTPGIRRADSQIAHIGEKYPIAPLSAFIAITIWVLQWRTH